MCGSARKALECIMWTCNQPIERATASFKRRWYLNFFRKPLRFWLEISEKRSRENTRWKENRNVIIDRRTDVQDRSSTNYIIIYGNPNILFTTISKCRDVEKVEHFDNGLSDRLACMFLFRFLGNSPWRRCKLCKMLVLLVSSTCFPFNVLRPICNACFLLIWNFLYISYHYFVSKN